MFAAIKRFTMLHTHIAWDMDDGGESTQAEQDGPYGSDDWHCYSFNRHDAWTKMHDWGCFNWNWVSKMHRREDPKEKDKYFL